MHSGSTAPALPSRFLPDMMLPHVSSVTCDSPALPLQGCFLRAAPAMTTWQLNLYLPNTGNDALTDIWGFSTSQLQLGSRQVLFPFQFNTSGVVTAQNCQWHKHKECRTRRRRCGSMSPTERTTHQPRPWMKACIAVSRRAAGRPV